MENSNNLEEANKILSCDNQRLARANGELLAKIKSLENELIAAGAASVQNAVKELIAEGFSSAESDLLDRYKATYGPL